jgi:hypothetical protein
MNTDPRQNRANTLAWTLPPKAPCSCGECPRCRANQRRETKLEAELRRRRALFTADR